MHCEDTSVSGRDALTNILRISYNFAQDAVKLIQLIVHLCDIKPIVLWCTLTWHYELGKEIEHLPWSYFRNTKPTLSNYQDIVRTARNRAFHSLIPFHESIVVDLNGIDISAKTLHLFESYTTKRSNPLDYQDRQIVELLAEFTRPREAVVPPSFWKQNLCVIEATRDLVRSTAECLVLLRKASGW